MGFDENREDFWYGRGGPSWSKKLFLETAARCGGVQTGRLNGEECPYYGAIAHAEELASEKLVEKIEVASVIDGEIFTCWMITPLGKIMAGLS
jgi:hypothetical protein